MLTKSFSICFLFLTVVSSYTQPTLPNPQVLVKDIYATRKLLDDKSDAQLAFWIAVNKGDTEGMKKAKAEGADPEDKTEPTGYRPIHLAASIGNPAVVDLLLEYNVDVNAKTNNGTTALHYTANHGDQKVTEKLLNAGADPNIADNRGFVPLHFAAYANILQFKGYASMMADGAYKSISIEASAEVSKTSSIISKTTTTGMGEFLYVVETLLKANAEPSAATLAKETPLHYTPAFDQFQISQLLIEAGADVNAVDQEQEIPLHEATAYGAIGVTQLLLMHGGDATAKEENGLTPQEFICRCQTYKGDPSLTQCAPDQCQTDKDKNVLNHIFNVYNGGD